MCKKFTMSTEAWKCNNDDFQTAAQCLYEEIKAATLDRNIKTQLFSRLLENITKLCKYHNSLDTSCSIDHFDSVNRALYEISQRFESIVKR